MIGGFLFWIAAAGLTALTVALLVRPLLGRPSEAEGDPLAIYRDQLAEVDRDIDRGVVDPAEGESLKAEIARRMLAADRKRATMPPPAAGTPRRGASRLGFALLAILPLAAIAVYLPTGEPNLPAQPFASRDAGAREALAARAAAVDALRAEVAADPSDLEGWLDLARANIDLERFDAAVDAYARAIGLLDDRPALRAEVTAAWAEMLVVTNSGIVSREAREAFREVLAENPDNPRARHYLALERRQAGALEEAWDRWVALVEDSPPDAPWFAIVLPELETLAADLDREMPALAPPLGPDADTLAAAADMAPEERAAMVEGMVDGLAARLAETPEDRQGWLRLANAYRVLDRPGDAADALRRAADLTEAPETRVGLLNTVADLRLAAEPAGALPEGFADLMAEIAALDPDNLQALWFQGLLAYQAGDTQAATTYWQRLYDRLPADSEERVLLADRLATLGVALDG